ncbi:MAG: hypothetical protein ACR2LQ_10660 [Acidimicrobiales bacterium]
MHSLGRTYAAVAITLGLVTVAACSSGSHATVKATNVGTLPVAVQDSFVTLVRAATDARGPLTVDYVQTTFGDAPQASAGAGQEDLPVYVLFVSGSYADLVSQSCRFAAPQASCQPPRGGIFAVIGLDGHGYEAHGTGGVGDPDLSRFGLPLTAVVDVGN